MGLNPEAKNNKKIRPGERSTIIRRKHLLGGQIQRVDVFAISFVKRLIAEPTVALIIYNQEKHVDNKGLPCHGPLDTKAAGTRAMFAPYFSDELRLWVLSLLYDADAIRQTI